MKRLLCLAVSLLFAYTSSAQLIINEVLYDPADSALTGDANGDGMYSQVQDEFIEFVNTGSAPLDISHYRIFDVVLSTGERTQRHLIRRGTVVPAGGAVVVFGGGHAVGSFGGAIVFVDSGTAGLSLGNIGEKIVITDSLFNGVDSIDTDALSNNPDESYTRNPDITGAFVQHHNAQAGVLFSPGLHVNGTPFAVAAALAGTVRASQMGVYPNPGTGVFHLTGQPAGQEIEVLDPTGRVVLRQTAGRGLDLSRQPQGSYYVRPAGAAQGVRIQVVR